MSIVIILIIAAIIIAVFYYKRHRGTISSDNFNTSSSTSSNISDRGTNRTYNNRGENNMETEIMEYFANARYNQKDRWFRFKYKKVGNEWRAYIIRMPPLNGKSASTHLTHRYSDGNGNYWVCRDPQTTTLHDAQVVSRVWADRLLEYTVTGIEANNQVW